jgi:hypothetical protein
VPSPTPNATAAHTPSGARPQKHVWPIFKVFAGGALGYFWLWGNTVQLATSEAWFNHLSGVTLTPHFGIIMQVADFWNGFDAQNTIAYTWAWGIQVLLLVFSIGIDWPTNTPQGKARAQWFKYGSIVCIALNSLADFFFSSQYGLWEQLAFTGITLMMSVFFGLLGLHLILSGLKEMFQNHSLRGA